MKEGIEKIKALKDDFWKNLLVPGEALELNQNLEKAGRVADLIELGELMMGRVGENYLLSGKYYTMKEIVAIVSEVKGKKIRVANVPVWLVQMGLPFVKLQSLITGKAPLYTNESIEILLHGNPKISHEKARLELNHNPRPFKDTITDLVEWFKTNGYIK